jgi:hypothetical protein
VPAGLFDGIEPEVLAPGKTTFAHLGDLHYVHRNPEALIRAFGELVAEGRVRPDQFELHFFGQRGRWEGRGVPDLAAQYGCRASVFEHDAVEHHRALSLMRGADVLVLLAERQPWAIPAKAYEYLASGTRVLALGEPDGATGRLLNAIRRARVVSSGEPASLKDALLALIAEREAGGRPRLDSGDRGPPLDIGWHLARMAEVLDAL